MVREIFKETQSRQETSLDHGEAETSHMSESLTENHVNISGQYEKEERMNVQPRGPRDAQN